MWRSKRSDSVKKSAVGKVAVDDADAVVGVERGDQVVAGVFDGAHVARRDKASGADEGEGFGVHLCVPLWSVGCSVGSLSVCNPDV